MSARREVAATAVASAMAGLLLLVVHPALGLPVLAGLGAALLLPPRPRAVVAGAVALLGLGVTTVGLAGSDLLVAAPGVVLALTGAVAAWRSPRWPPPRRDARRDPRAAPTARDAWDALDRGEDPTL